MPQSKNLGWADIKAVATGLQMHGAQGTMYMSLISGNPSKKSIQFYYTSFPRHELHLLLQLIRTKAVRAEFDKGTEELLKRSERSFVENYHAG
jgi:hypothetical protein